ncbi:hypothetical protein COB55_03300 [Candidatus Wolfebacteria bacterium]|nr:MAG: hypothetical protein COB55_03300 [Candidatus Wolfebacteria bacterium]
MTDDWKEHVKMKNEILLDIAEYAKDKLLQAYGQVGTWSNDLEHLRLNTVEDFGKGDQFFIYFKIEREKDGKGN